MRRRGGHLEVLYSISNIVEFQLNIYQPTQLQLNCSRRQSDQINWEGPS